MSERIYLSAPDVGPLEEEALLRAMRSGWIAPLGPEVDAFEAEIAQVTQRDYAVALSSGTAALHLGLLGLGVKPGDTVICATMTFAATANAVVYAGAKPYFVDSDIETGNMNPVLLAEALESIYAGGGKVAAIIPVDLLGKVADYGAINKIAQQYEVPVLADAAESLGATGIDGKSAGAHGAAAIFSFNGNKVITTSGGGMLVTDDKQLADYTRYLATQARQPVVHYEHTEIGYNYRLSNLLAAVGRAQLSRLKDMIAARKAIRDEYRRLFESIAGVAIFGGQDDERDNHWLSSIIVDDKIAGWQTSDLAAALSQQNIESRPLWKPMHLQPVFADASATIDGSSQKLFEQGLTLPSGSALTQEQKAFVLETIQEFLERH